jgi:hypothetical protein
MTKSRVRPRGPAAAAAALLVFLLGAATAPAVEPREEIVRLMLREGSRLWLEGDSNIKKWSCDAMTFVPELRVERVAPEAAPTRVQQATLTVPVARIDCGIDKMNENLRGALNTEENENIVFEVTRAEFVAPMPRGSVEVHATGRLTAAGVTRPLELRVLGTDTGNGALRLRGHVAIRMTEYGVKPPTAMLGLLRTKDEVLIHFDLLADYEQLATAIP